MNTTAENAPASDKRLAAVCGLFCPSCTLFIGTNQNLAGLKATAKSLQRPVEELECHGCRSQKRCFYCQDNCKMAKCATEKGIDFCGECAEYPCAELEVFQAEMPHRIELWKSQARIKEVGYEKWYVDMIEHYSCPQCHALNSAYNMRCWKCGNTPSCNYVAEHQDEISHYLVSVK